MLRHSFAFLQNDRSVRDFLSNRRISEDGADPFWRDDGDGWLGQDCKVSRVWARHVQGLVVIGEFHVTEVDVEDDAIERGVQHFASLSQQIHEVLTKLAGLSRAECTGEIGELLSGTANLPAHPWTIALYDLAGRYVTPEYAAEIELNGTCAPAPSIRYRVETEAPGSTATSDATTTVDEGSIASTDARSLLESHRGKAGNKVEFTISPSESTMPELESLAEILAWNVSDPTVRKDSWVSGTSLSNDVFSTSLNAIHSIRSWLEGDVSPVSRTEGLLLAETAGKEPISSPSIERADKTGRDAANIFQRSGSDWMIRYGGQEDLYQGLHGFFYLHVLVANQGRWLPPNVLLADRISAEHGRPTVSAGLAKADDLSLLATDAGPVIDSEALEAYKEEYEELCAEIEKAQGYEKEDLMADKTDLEQQLCQALGVGPATLEDKAKLKGMTRLKTLSPAAKNNRDKVMKAIDTALRHIEKKNPAAAVHFGNSLHRETLLCYRPESHIEWLT